MSQAADIILCTQEAVDKQSKHVLYRYYSSQRQVKLSSDDGSDTKIALKSPPAARWSLRGSDVMQHE